MSAAAAAFSRELVLGRYRPLRPLGSGGSGSVWLAKDERNGLDVALKIVPREGKAAHRAEREAQAAALLRHERCLRAYDFASDERHVYISYEYVPGRTLRQALRAGEVDDRAAVQAAVQILEGLAHAHGRGIVHRDVKPSNVLLADGARMSVRLLDFGLAQFAEADTLTAAGDVPGTLAYISPERLRGELATAAADVWSVGVLLWEALSGWHPFWTSSLLDTARKIETGPPPLHTSRPDLPRRLTTAVDRALQLEPPKRPSAAELAVELHSSFQERDRRRKRRSNVVASARRPLPIAVPSTLLQPLASTAHATAAAVFAAWTAASLPFYPAHWSVGLAALAFGASFFRARVGLAFAAAVPVLPLANVSLGLAVLYGALAVTWLVLFWQRPRAALAFLAGPLLAPIAALGLLPLLLQPVRGPVRRALTVATAVLAAGLVAGIRHVPLPFVGAQAPLGLGIAGSERPSAVASALWRGLVSRPELPREALVLALASLLLPPATRRGLWGIAALGAFLVAGTLLTVPDAHALPLALTAWATCLALGARAAR
jgi:hypothetical protein